MRDRAAAAILVVLSLCAAALGQDAPPPTKTTPTIKTPDLAEPVLKLLEAPYLTDDERRDLRVFHGVWREDDLNTPQRRASAALIRGALDDAALGDAAAVAAEDRAEGQLLAGELESCLAMLGDSGSLRAIRIRAEALEGLGRTDEAAKALEPLVEKLTNEQLTLAAELVEGGRALMIRARIRPQEEPAGGDFKRMNALLARARDKLGRLYWPAYLAEAALLHSKDNGGQAVEAIAQCLGLCPGSAEAWRLLGVMQVEGFNFEAAEKAAERLDKLAGGASPGATEVLARARLRQNDPDGAAAVVEPMLERFPKMRR